MRTSLLAVALVAAVMLLRPITASAHRVVVLGGPPVIAVAPAPCGGGFYPGYVAPGYYPGFGPDLRVYDPMRYYRWYYGQYFPQRSERIYGYTLPGRR
jgi:hypothetical protein